MKLTIFFSKWGARALYVLWLAFFAASTGGALALIHSEHYLWGSGLFALAALALVGMTWFAYHRAQPRPDVITQMKSL
jgi:membrane protein implicated in regulation of membrane protease activity